jgi:hypothetical protein
MRRFSEGGRKDKSEAAFQNFETPLLIFETPPLRRESRSLLGTMEAMGAVVTGLRPTLGRAVRDFAKQNSKLSIKMCIFVR